MFSLICVWINGWINNGEAGDLKRYRTHYNVTVMWGVGVRNMTDDESFHDKDDSGSYAAIYILRTLSA